MSNAFRDMLLRFRTAGTDRTVSDINRVDTAMDNAERSGKETAESLKGLGAAGRTGRRGLDSFNKGANSVRDTLLSLDAATNLAAKGVKTVGSAASALAFPAQLAVDWEFGLAKIRAVALGLPDDFGTALEGLAAKVPQTQADLLKAAEDLARAGVEGGKIVPQLQVASRLAVAAGADLETASSTIRLASNVWKDFGINAEKAGDILFEVTRQAPIGLEDLQGNLGKIATMASEMNIPLETATAGIAALAKAGVDVETGTTQIRALLSALVSVEQAGPKLRKNLEKYFGTFEEAVRQIGPTAVQTDGLAVVMQRLSKATDGNVAAMRSLFPNIRAFGAALVGAKDGGQDLISIMEAVEGSAGSVSKGFDIMGNTVQGAINRFKASFEGAALRIGKEFLPMIQEGLDQLEQWWTDNADEIIESTKEMVREFSKWAQDEGIPTVVQGLERMGAWWKANGPALMQVIVALGSAIAKTAQFAIDLSNMPSVMRMDLKEAEKQLKSVNINFDRMADRMEGLSLERLRKSQTLIQQQLVAQNKLLKEGNFRYRVEEDLVKARIAGYARVNKVVAEQIQLRKQDAAAFDPVASAEEARRVAAILQGSWNSLANGVKGSMAAIAEAEVKVSKVTGKGKPGGLTAEQKRAAKQRLREAERQAKELSRIRLAAEIASLQVIEDENVRAWRELMIKQEFALSERKRQLGENAVEVQELIKLHAAQRLQLEAEINRDYESDFERHQKRLTDIELREEKKREKERKDAAKKAKEEDKKRLEALTNGLEDIGRGFASAAVGAALFGGSFTEAVNQSLKALAQTAAVEALMSLGKGFAALALGPIGGASATAYFKSAGYFGAVAALSGLGAAATGGVSSGGGGGGGPSPATAPSSGDVRQRDTSGDRNGNQPIVINFGGTMPLATKTDIANAVAEVMDVGSRSRGRKRFEANRYSRRPNYAT